MAKPKTASFARLAMVLASLCALTVGVANVNGCGSTHPLASDPNGETPGGTVVGGPCTVEGSVTDCHVETGRVDNIVNCFHGTQVCHDGKWGPCGGGPGGGSVSTASLSSLAEQGERLYHDLGVGVHPLAIVATSPSRDATGCAQNPCNPDCVGIDVDAGILQPDGGFVSTSTVYGTVSDPTSFPGGSTGPKSAAMTGISAPPSFLCTSVPTGTFPDGGVYGKPPPTDYKECNYDYCCGLSDAGPRCLPWVKTGADNVDAIATCKTPLPTDYTLGLGCVDSSGNTHVPVCNRGQTSTPSSGTLMLGSYSGNPNAAGSSSVCIPNGGASETCAINLATVKIDPGKCVDINMNAGQAGTATGYTCTGAPSGNRTFMINPGSSFAVSSASEVGTTATITTGSPHGLTVGRRVLVTGVGGLGLNVGYNGTFTVTAVTANTFQYTNPTSGLGAAGAGGSVIFSALDDGDYCDNYSFLPTAAQGNACAAYGVQPPPPAALSYTFTATCPSGSRVRWNQFAYNTAVPNSSEVTFVGSTAPTFPDGGTGSFGTVRTFADILSSSGDPPYCAFSGLPDAQWCPKNLATILGADAYNPVLKIGVTLTATTAIPTVYGWNVSYVCEAIE